MPVGRVFAPAGDNQYIFSSNPDQPSLVVDRPSGSSRVAPADELIALIGAHSSRAKSVKVDAIVGIIDYPDDRFLVVVTDVGNRILAACDGVENAPFINKVAFLPLKPPGAGGDSTADQWHTPTTESKDPAVTLGAKQRAHLKDFLEAGDFYIANADRCALTHTLQRRAARGKPSNIPSLEDADYRFVWNYTALEPLTTTSPSGAWLTPIMQAAIATEQVVLPGGSVLTASVISRRSCEHAGTRFKTRGINDLGAAANFLEIEQILHMKGKRSAVTALVQVRGSVYAALRRACICIHAA